MKFPKTVDVNFTRNLVKRYKLVPHLDQFLVREAEFSMEVSPKEKDDAWHPSGHCTPSVSDLYHYATEEHEKPRDFSASLMKTFAVGHFWHAYLQWAVVELEFATPESIERRGIRQWGEELPMSREVGWGSVRSRPFHYATGSGDVAPLVLPKHGEFVCDFKTMSSHQFKANGLPEWAAGKYEAQINIYMDWFDQERALIVAINKDSPHDMKEFEFERNQPLIDAIYDKWEFVSELIDAGEAPDEEDNLHFSLEDLYMGPVAQ